MKPLKYLEIELELIKLLDSDKLESYYDSIYTMYTLYDYNKESMPKSINTMMENIFEFLYNEICYELIRYKASLLVGIDRLESQHEIDDDDEIIEQIKDKKSLLNRVVNLLSLGDDYSDIERVLVILYNDIDPELTGGLKSHIQKVFSDAKTITSIKRLSMHYKMKSCLERPESKFKNIVLK